MLLLEALGLLKLGLMTPTEVSTVIETVKTEKEFQDRIRDRAVFNQEDYVKTWSSLGVDRLADEVWNDLIIYYTDYVISAIQSATEVSRSIIESRMGVVNDVIRRASINVAVTPLRFGQSIEKIIRKEVKTVFNNNSRYFKAQLIGKDNDEAINPTVMDLDKTYYNKVDDLVQALRNVPADEVRALLYDISESNTIYKMDTSRSTKYEYSIYESFLRSLFELRMQKFNERYKSIVTVSMLEHLDNKYEKFDFVMFGLLEGFIMPGISKTNINQFLNALFLQVKLNKATSAAPLFSLEEVSTTGFVGGNYRTDRRLSKRSASLNFNLVARAFIALSKLYGYLVAAGISPFRIHPRVFEDSSGNACERFISLEELVFHSHTVIDIQDKYNIGTSLVPLVALQSKDAVEGTILPISGNQVILDNRQSLNLFETANSFSMLLGNPNPLAGYRGFSVSTVHFTDQNSEIHPCCNLLEFVEYIRLEKNPLYTIRLSTNDLTNNDFWDLEYLDLSVMASFFSEVLGVDASGVSDIYASVNYIETLIQGTNSTAELLLHDLSVNDRDTTTAIISAIRKFAEDFLNDTYNLIHPTSDIHRSDTEYYVFLIGMPLLEPLHKIVDLNKPNYISFVDEVIHTLVSKYEEHITLEDIIEFLNPSNYKLEVFKSFVYWIKHHIFKELTGLFHNAQAQLSGLSDVGPRVELTGDELEKVIMGATPISQTDAIALSKMMSGISKNKNSYYVDESGDIYSLICVNNKYGALHSSGYYVFQDGSTIQWNKVV